MICKLCGKEMEIGFEDYTKYYYCNCDLSIAIENKKEEIYRAKQEVLRLEKELKILQDSGIYAKELKAFKERFCIDEVI